MYRPTRATGDAPQPQTEPGVCVFDADNEPMPRVSLADAEFLVWRGWARWAGKGSNRRLRLTERAPLQRLPRHSAGTRRDRADQTCKLYGDGQCFGSKHIVEHKPLH